MSERTLANGRYALSEPPIGAGGMGTVWKAYDTVLHREVAVKELRIPDGLSPEDRDKLLARAMREARAAAGLDHPAIVTIHDVVDEGGRPWIVMRLLSGRSLDLAVRTDGPLSPRAAAELGVRLLDALTAAHTKGVLHRDVKPHNVMLDGGGRWMLTDFGIASVAGATRTLTGTGLVTGTLGYIAPERLSGTEPGAAADLWSLGATLYFAVEGQHAYDHDDLPAMIAAVLTRDPEPPRKAGPLAPVIAGLLERDPDRRLDAEAARERLLAVAEGRPTFEAPTVQLGASGRPTEKLGGSTRVLREPRPGEGLSFVWRNRVLRALAWLLMTMNGAVGVLLGLIVYGLSDGMPVWIAGALAAAFAVGGGLGAWLAPHVARWLRLTTALVWTALLMGESFVGAGAVGAPESPVAAIVLVGVALVSFAAWHRLARSMRRRIVPTELLGRVTTIYRATGFAAILLGGGVAGGYFVLVDVYGLSLLGGNYVVGLPVTAGVVVTVAGLLAIPAVRDVSAGGSGSSGTIEPPKRWAPIGAAITALVIPVFLGGQALARYVDRLDDFTAVPDICASDVLSQDRIAQFIADPPAPEKDSYSSDVTCSWRRTAGDDGSSELDIDLTKYDDSGAAARRFQRDQEYEEGEGKTVVGLQLGDEGSRYPYDGSIDSEDTLGVSVVVRVDNVLLEVDLDQSEALGTPDADKLEALATELVREIENQKPSR